MTSKTEKVEVGSLEPDQVFSLGGVKYTVSAVYPFAVMAVPLKQKPSAKAVEKLPLNTLVSTAIKPSEE